jgi:hypothetical protein
MKKLFYALLPVALFVVFVAANTPMRRLASGKLFVGNASNYARPVDMSGDATISNAGVVTVSKASGSFGVTSQTIGVDLSNFRIHDDIDAILNQAAGDDDDLTLIQGTLGTNATTIETIDCGGLNDTTQYGSFWFVVPPSYIAGSTVSLVANAGMVTTVADQSATVDFSCYVPDYANADGTVSSDLITTDATSVNSLTFADKTFVVDDDVSGHALAAGSLVQCRLTALCDDDGNAGDNITIRINKLDVVISE